MSETVQIDDLSFLVRRSAQRKTIGLTVERDSTLVAHLPEGVDLGTAREVIRTKQTWVYQKLATQNANASGEVFRRPELVDGEGFYFLGKHYRLKLVDVDPDRPPLPAVRFEKGRLFFLREQAAAGERRIAEYYTRAAYPYLNEVVRRWKGIVGVEPASRLQVKELGFRWGSCSFGGTLNFHWRVMQLPPQVIDYVVVHELAHLKVADHSPAFWREVRRVLPGYDAQRDWLRVKGGEL